jgi:uncharacterized membrane protein HdeD (DUF308 family)
MTKENTESDDMICCSQDSEGGDMMKHCPMAERFDEIIGKSQLGFYLIIFGIALVVLGIAIVVKPSILVWLAGAVATLTGIVLLIAAFQINRMKSSLRD